MMVTMKKKILAITVIIAAVVAGASFLLMDLDGDGLSNFSEIQHGTALGNPDTDGDGLSDRAEVSVHKTNPLVPDTDGDNLGDFAEVSIYHTNPLAADSDNDGIGDWQEVNTYDTNPLSPDTDNDDLGDFAELFTYRTNPKLADTDNDGLGDFSEINTYGTDSLDNDTDNDRLNDGLEVNGWSITVNGSTALAKSNPLSNDSDGDNLSDWVEHSTYHSNPESADTDNDGQGDLLEVLYNTDLSSASSVASLIENAPTRPQLNLEIGYMTGHAPAPEAISYLKSYFENDLGVLVETAQREVTNAELAAVGVSTESISPQELNTIEAHFHENHTTQLYVFYASELEDNTEGGSAAPTFGVAINGEYLPEGPDPEGTILRRGRTILLHEIGHAIGLDHTNDPASAMQSGPTFREPVYASVWSQRNLLDIWSVDEPWNQ